ncbi:site-specific integrase [Parabacteroides sp. OttesenSCG-928-J18]|nr:site-specific integrase [Parabacteroides sp. OttesenSCG-928-O15]MDL2244452.1 site-specific integrase [Parabacteroides sp. OttesenSCG-928-J18]
MGKQKLNRGHSFKLFRELSNGEYTIAMVLRINGQRCIISLPFSATISQWDEATQRYIDDNTARSLIKNSALPLGERKLLLSQLHPDRMKNNLYLDRKSNELNDIIDDFERRKVPYTANMVKERLFTVISSASVEKYLVSQIGMLKESNRHGTARTYEDLHFYLKKYDPNFSKKVFPEIDYNFVNNFYLTQLESGRERGGIGVNLRALRTLLNDAIKDNVGSPETYPFSNQYGTRTGKNTFSLSTMVKTVTRKRYIPHEYLIKFYNYEFDSTPHRRSKHLFFFSFFCGGINFADMMKLKESDIKTGLNNKHEEIQYFIYERSKTKEYIEIQINDDIQRELDSLKDPEFGTPVDGYLLPIVTKKGLTSAELEIFKINKRKKLNKYLKEMAEIMGFPESIRDMSTYFARHSFAMQLFSKTGSIDKVSAGLHHSNTEITKVYLESFGKDEVAKMTDGLLR